MYLFFMRYIMCKGLQCGTTLTSTNSTNTCCINFLRVASQTQDPEGPLPPPHHDTDQITQATAQCPQCGGTAPPPPPLPAVHRDASAQAARLRWLRVASPGVAARSAQGAAWRGVAQPLLLAYLAYFSAPPRDVGV